MKTIVTALFMLAVLTGIATQGSDRTYANGAPSQAATAHPRLPTATTVIWIARFDPPSDMGAPTPGPTDPNGPPA
jgi:hypothetical protein